MQRDTTSTTKGVEPTLSKSRHVKKHVRFLLSTIVERPAPHPDDREMMSAGESSGSGGGGALVEAQDSPADFLFLRQLGQGVTLRLSDPIDVPPADSASNLLCVSNQHGLLFAATFDGFIAHQLKDVRGTLTSAGKNASPTLEAWARKQTTSDTALGARVSFLRTADNEKTLLAALDNGRIAGWTIGALSPSSMQPSFVLDPPKANLKVRELAPNPAEKPELCAVLYVEAGQNGAPKGSLALCNVQNGQWQGEITPPEPTATTAVCWSVRGKQLALGLDNGEIVQMTPENQAKDRIARPGSLEGTPYVESVLWLENHVFVTTYNQPATSEEPEHQYEVYSILRDPKASSQLTFVHFNDPAPPFGDTSRRGHRYASWLKAWDPLKHMIFIANTSSTDVGLVGCNAQSNEAGGWQNLDLEDTSRPALPFSSVDKSSDTSPVGLCFDLTATDNVDDPQAAARGEDGTGKLSPVPILLVYTNDGVLLAYHVINVDSNAGRYSGLVASTSIAADGGEMSTDAPAASSKETVTTPQAAPAPAPSTPSSSTSAPAFGQSSPFGSAANASKPAFGQSSAFGSAASTSTPAFGQSSPFGSAASTPAFGKPAQIGASTSSPFSAIASPSGTPKDGGPSFSGGFGGFASKGQGASSFGSPSPSAASPFASAGQNTPSFGAQSTGKKEEGAKSSAFGAFASGSSNFGSTASNTSTFGSTSTPSAAPAAPAFACTSTPTSGASPSGFGTSQPASAFGSASSFGQKSAFGQPSAFGQTSAFGQPSAFGSPSSFGKPSTFGSPSGTAPPSASAGITSPAQHEKPTTPAASSSPSTPSAFGAFASKPASTGFSFGSTAAKSSAPDGSVFGSGGTLAGTETSKPLFASKGEHSSSSVFSFGKSSTPSASASFGFGSSNDNKSKSEAVATPKEEPGDKLTDAGSLSFGGFGDLLGETKRAEDVALPEEAGVPSKEATESSPQPDKMKQSPAGERTPDKTIESLTLPPSESASVGAEKTSTEEAKPVAVSLIGERKSDKDEAATKNEADSSKSSTDANTETSPQNNEAPQLTTDDTKESRPVTPSVPSQAQEDDGEKRESEGKTASSFEASTPAQSTAQKSSEKITKSSQPMEPPSTPSSAFGSAKASPFLNFKNSAPRSSSPLSGTPLNISDLSNSPEKSDASKAQTKSPFSFGAAPTFGQPLTTPKSPSTAPRSEPFSFAKPQTYSSDKSNAFPTSSTPAPPPASTPFSAPVQKPASPSPAVAPAKTSAPAQSFVQPKSESKSSFPAPSTSEKPKPATAAPRQPVLSQQPPKLAMSNQTTTASESNALPDLFLQLYLTMEEEVQILKDNAQRCKTFQDDLRERSLNELGRKQLKDASHWTFGELENIASITQELHADVKLMDAQRQESRLRLRKIQSEQLKVETKREEIARFIRAKNDPAFRKMIKVRQLGPEHAENQARLRKAFSSLQQSIDELDAHIARLHSQALDEKLGRPASMQAPSLDAVRRTVRNITRTAQVKMLELEELQLSFEMLSGGKKRMQARAASQLDADMSIASGKDEIFDTLNSLHEVLPKLSATSTGGTGVDAFEVQRKADDFKRAFLQARSQPILNRREASKTSQDSYKSSDLNMAFAKGPIMIDRAKPIKQEPKPAAPTVQAESILPKPPSAEQKPNSFSSFGLGGPLQTSKLPDGVFDLPPEAMPFAPRASSPSAAPGRHHAQKQTNKKNVAVALPTSQPSTAPSAPSDFFAKPAQGEAKSLVGATATPFTAAAAKASGGTSAFGDSTRKDASTDKPAFSFAKPAEEAPKPAFSFAKPSEEAQKPAFSFAKPSEEASKPAFSFAKPSEEAQKPAFSFAESSEPTTKPASSFAKPTEEGPKPAFSSFANASEGAQKPSFSFAKPSQDASSPTFSFARPSKEPEKPAFSFAKPSDDAKLKSAGEEQKSTTAPSRSPKEAQKPGFSFAKLSESIAQNGKLDTASTPSFAAPQDGNSKSTFSFAQPSAENSKPAVSAFPQNKDSSGQSAPAFSFSSGTSKAGSSNAFGAWQSNSGPSAFTTFKGLQEMKPVVSQSGEASSVDEADDDDVRSIVDEEDDDDGEGEDDDEWQDEDGDEYGDEEVDEGDEDGLSAVDEEEEEEGLEAGDDDGEQEENTIADEAASASAGSK